MLTFLFHPPAITIKII